VEFEEAVAKAPPGWRHFTEGDIARLPEEVRKHELARVPDGEHGERLVRGLFWTLVYHLEPERWDELASFEPIHPDVVAALPPRVATAVDVGAGSGRLTAHLVRRSRRTVAVEPSAGLRAMLEQRLPQVEAIAGWAERTPLPDGWSELTAACGAFGPEGAILAELRRVTAPGGTIALISPEQPEWFEAAGWRRITLPPIPAPEHPRRLDEFFGPLDPPHELVLLRI
jgi:SAM-dependent methyltransferase